MMLAHPLRMADRLMAGPANRDQVSPLDTVGVPVIPAESQVREQLDMLDVMHHHRRIGSAADLAVPVIVPQDRS